MQFLTVAQLARSNRPAISWSCVHQESAVLVCVCVYVLLQPVHLPD